MTPSWHLWSRVCFQAFNEGSLLKMMEDTSLATEYVVHHLSLSLSLPPSLSLSSSSSVINIHLHDSTVLCISVYRHHYGSCLLEKLLS